jgi:hypothetical protein
MKKLMTMMLGLSLMFGGVAAFAQDKPADTTSTTKPKKVKKVKVKKEKVSKSKAAKTDDTTVKK